MLRFKPDVRIGAFNPQLYEILRCASAWSLIHRIDVQVNSIEDPAPGRVASSLHPYGLAVDVEPIGNVEVDRVSLSEYFKRLLDPQFDVVYENSHTHIEWDAHRGPLRSVTT